MSMPQLYQLNDIYPTIMNEGAFIGMPVVLIRLHGCAVGCQYCAVKHTWAGQQPIRNETPEKRTAMHVLNAAQERDTASPGAVMNGEADWLGPNAKWTTAPGEVIANWARLLGRGLKWVVLTGGEPAAQPLAELIDALHRENFKVALETSGTATGHVEQWSTYHKESVPALRAGGTSLSCGPQWSLADWTTVSPKLDNPGGLPIQGDALRGATEVRFVIGGKDDFDRMALALDVWIKAGLISDECKVTVQPMNGNDYLTGLCAAYCLRYGISMSVQTRTYGPPTTAGEYEQ